MPKANPFAQIAKRLASLQAKSAKIDAELSALVEIVDVEMKKQDAAPAPAKVAPAKKAGKSEVVSPKTVATAIAVPKKKGRPAKK